jgi:hypothetical protein
MNYKHVEEDLLPGTLFGFRRCDANSADYYVARQHTVWMWGDVQNRVRIVEFAAREELIATMGRNPE